MKLRHLFDIGVYLAHRTFWILASKFGHVHGMVLMYHYITDDNVNTVASCLHKPAVFEATLKRLLCEGYSFVSVEEMLSIIERRDAKKFVVVTFDDVMDDVYSNAYPILKRLQIPFALFVASGLLETKNYVTKEHLQEMANDGLCTVGAHSVSHCRLSSVKNSKEEVLESKRQLEDLLGHPVVYFAYPYGWHCDVSRNVMKEVEAAGFKCAFGTIQSPVSEISGRRKYYLPRMVLMK